MCFLAVNLAREERGILRYAQNDTRRLYVRRDRDCARPEGTAYRAPTSAAIYADVCLESLVRLACWGLDA